mgnify:CR=1 FL=1
MKEGWKKRKSSGDSTQSTPNKKQRKKQIASAVSNELKKLQAKEEKRDEELKSLEVLVESAVAKQVAALNKGQQSTLVASTSSKKVTLTPILKLAKNSKA